MSTLISNAAAEILSLSPYGETRSTIGEKPLSTEELRRTDAYWRACNYLSLGMIYLLDNPLLAEPLRPEHIKSRLLGHWGSSPGLSFIYVHLNRLIKKSDLDMIFLAGPGHGAPGVLGPAYLEGTYSEVYPEKSQDVEGLRQFFRGFSFPGGIGSHCTPETPGSIHEGGELGYVLSHACGAAFDNPELIVAAVVGEGESETGSLAASWTGNKCLNPPREGEGQPLEGFWRAYQEPLPDVKKDPEQLRILETWMRSLKPEDFFDGSGKFAAPFRDLAPKGNRRMSANPHANGGRVKEGLRLPDFREYGFKFEKPGQSQAENTRSLGALLRDVMKLNMRNFRVCGPDETTSNKLDAIYAVRKKFWIEQFFPDDMDGGELATDGRVMEMLSEHTVEGMLDGYLV